MLQLKKNHSIIGVMSGTSLDGIDIVNCNFKKNKKWLFDLIACESYKYDEKWKNILKNLHLSSREEIKKIDKKYGKLIGHIINSFIKKNNLNVEYVASHGHTIFHDPKKKFTLQIGCGKEISKITGLNVIYDFRSLDVSLGGQGAPLVPIGDLFLFPKYKYCLNIGGFANFSVKEKNKILKSYDICPANFVLNFLSSKIGFDFDKDGLIAKNGYLNKFLLEKLNSIDFYLKEKPKSLSREWVEKEIYPLLINKKTSSLLSTFCEHIAIQISNKIKNDQVLVSGGGVHNKYLMSRIKYHCKSKIITPNKDIIDFKEAIIFGLLGILKLYNQNNCLSIVTGAKKDNSGGKIILT